MNEALNRIRIKKKYRYMPFYPIKFKSDPIIFLRGADCWGWAAWSRPLKYSTRMEIF